MTEWTLDSLAESYRRLGFKMVAVQSGEPNAACEIWIRPDPVRELLSDDRYPAGRATVLRRFGTSWIELGRTAVALADDDLSRAPRASSAQESDEPQAAAKHAPLPIVGQLQIGGSRRRRTFSGA